MMKKKEKEFNIYANERPKVLLLGNGINRAFKGPSWDALLDQIKESSDFPLAAKDYNMPMPLKAAMLTDNKIGEKMRELISPKGDDSAEDGKVHWESFVNFEDEEKEYLKKLLDLKFDYILTTNYSYEIEAALSKKDLTRNYLEGLNTHIEVDNAQTRYMLNTFNRISADGNEYDIWHIHGEARKPDSMIIGHNYYGRLLSKIIDRLIGKDKIGLFKNNIKKKQTIKIGSWTDAFILGDVYIVGFGFDFSETDLWWLLDQKNIDNTVSGKTVYFVKGSKENIDVNKSTEKECPLDKDKMCETAGQYILQKECHKLLMKTYGVIIEPIDENDYEIFYNKVYEKLKAELGEPP